MAIKIKTMGNTVPIGGARVRSAAIWGTNPGLSIPNKIFGAITRKVKGIRGAIRIERAGIGVARGGEARVCVLKVDRFWAAVAGIKWIENVNTRAVSGAGIGITG